MATLATETAPAVKTKIRLIVGHINPDDDVWLCFWLLKKFMPEAAEAEYAYVPAGTSLEGTEDDPTVIHVDTGLGELDQHGKMLPRSCSARLVAEKLGIAADPSLAPLLEMVTQVDNAEKLEFTSIHFLIVGLPYLHRKADNKTDWDRVRERVFEFFEIIHTQAQRRVAAEERFHAEAGGVKTLANGLKIALLPGKANLRDAAYLSGYDVALWTVHQKNSIWVGIGVNRDSHVRLNNVISRLRFSEGLLRGQTHRLSELDFIGGQGPIGEWFLHESGKLILCGSNSAPLPPEKCTKLGFDMIQAVVCQVLAKEE